MPLPPSNPVLSFVVLFLFFSLVLDSALVVSRRLRDLSLLSSFVFHLATVDASYLHHYLAPARVKEGPYLTKVYVYVAKLRWVPSDRLRGYTHDSKFLFSNVCKASWFGRRRLIFLSYRSCFFFLLFLFLTRSLQQLCFVSTPTSGNLWNDEDDDARGEWKVFGWSGGV